MNYEFMKKDESWMLKMRAGQERAREDENNSAALGYIAGRAERRGRRNFMVGCVISLLLTSTGFKFYLPKHLTGLVFIREGSVPRFFFSL